MMYDAIFHLNDDELSLVNAKKGKQNKLGFAVLLKYFQLEGRYPKEIKFVDPMILASLANQLNISAAMLKHFDFEGRSTERFRQEIRNYTGYRLATLEDVDVLQAWLVKEVFPYTVKITEQIEYAYTYFSERKIEPFTSKELERHVRSAHRKFEQDLFFSIENALTDTTKEKMDKLLSEEDSNDAEEEPKPGSEIKFRDLKHSIPGAKLKHVERALEKINCLIQLELPIDLLRHFSIKLVKKYTMRVMAELPGSMLEYKPTTRYALFALFCYHRSQVLMDDLADLLMQLIHQMELRAEKFIDKKILSEVKRVDGKFDILYQLSSTALNNPTGIIQDTIYPEVSCETLDRLVVELKSRGKWYEKQVQTKMRSLYSHAHRKEMLALLKAFKLKTNLQESQPLLNAIQFVLKHTESTDTYYPENISEIAIEKVVSGKWYDAVVECEEKNQRNNKTTLKKVNRINYELAIFNEFRKQLNCKMIWLEGAYRYRDPNEDLPKDFEENREFYYRLLGLPLDVQEFISSRKNTLDTSLRNLNDSILANPNVSITTRNGGHIKISPYDPQIEPPNIKKLHRAIKKEWPSINLIDILKETELDIEFINLFQTVASREAIPDDVLRFRLLLCLYAIGTNTGIKAVSAANASANESNLRYVKRKFINVDAVRQAIVKIINKTLEIRDPRIFGEATTSVACDSKKLSVWDQNLLVEWHARYRGRGVMVYWHVEKKALCVYSQLKTCSSSEVGAMLKGLLQHCTDMEIDSVYVDTHGQSTLAFGVSDLLEIDLLPRLKNISKQKLYYSSSQDKEQYKNLDLILKESIKWKLIEENYDEAVKHVVALKLGIMEPDVFVKRFSRDNYQHPVYKTIIEMGKIKKTNFLCRYLDSEELRMEVHESQNVVERLNSIMGFIFYGKLGEISTNIKEDQELAIVCLHLLQACMSYVNTIIFQTVLSRPEWQNKLTVEDKRALNLLFHSHINPYGLFPLDLEKRLNLMIKAMDNDEINAVKDRLKERLPEEELSEMF